MNRNVLEFLEEAVRNVPQKVVFADDKTELTYSQLADRAKRIGSALHQILGGKTGQAVAVLTDRSIQPLPGFFGAVYSGNFYVPVDRRLPASRMKLILDTVEAKVILAGRQDERILAALRETAGMNAESGTGTEKAAAISDCGENAEKAAADQSTENSEEQLGRMFPQIYFSEELAERPIDEAALIRIWNQQLDTDPLYAIFTSGSTGVPKGVLVSHRSVLDLADQFREEFDFDETCVFGNQAPFDFDVSVKDIYSTLRNQATMHVISQMRFSFPVKLVEYLNERKINTLIWAVSAFRIIENLNGFSAGEPKYLRRIFFSGEAMPVRVLNYLRRYLPEVKYVNLYGPTEITCNCTFYEVDREFAEGELLPIGRAFRNSGVFLLDGDTLVSEPGQSGEICVKGTCLALGYYNAPEKTAEAFCQNPLNPHYPERIYRTGDIGKYDENGSLVFLSRKDAQIKHMGHRIEPGEIEAAVGALEFIEAGVCIYAKGEICLCYQAKEACEKEILRGLAQKLPKYMFPTRFLWYRTLPVNKNGKIDRAYLTGLLRAEDDEKPQNA